MAQNKFKFSILFYILFLFGLVVIFLYSAEMISRKNFVNNLRKMTLIISPKPLFIPETSMGWFMKPGEFKIAINDSNTFTKVTIDSEGKRINPFEVSEGTTYEKLIQIYGCSNTFGYSVDDSSTQAACLQRLLPKSKVENRAVPAYNLAQMFLYLKNNIQNGKKPDIAVFNYANFHDVRSPLHKYWSSQIWWATTQGDPSEYSQLTYPYFDLKKDELILKTIKFDDLTKFWKLSEKYAFANRLNYLLYKFNDNQISTRLKQTSIKTAEEIMKYCNENEIIPIFAFMENADDVEPDPEILDYLKSKGHLTLRYGLDYGTDGYNNCPNDCGHPSAKAQKVFAEKLYQFLILKDLVINE